MNASPSQPETLRAAILGSDLILAALPAEPVQVVNSCLALGFDLVVPASWGDEIIASGVLDELALRPPGTAILCSCPHARRRMLSAGGELSPFIVQTVPPPVAAARYLRALNSDTSLRITYIGACPGADDASISDRITPRQFLDMCATHGLSLPDQPKVFESFISTDRRRFFSLPGGMPTPDAVRDVHADVEVLSVDAGSLAYEVAQCVVSGRAALLDLAPAVSCACSGFPAGAEAHDGRETLIALEPPRSNTPVVDARIEVDLELPGRTPLPTAYEESVPLSVVVGADLSGFTAMRGGDADSRNHSDDSREGDVEKDADTLGDAPPPRKPALSDSVREIEFQWSESDFDFDTVAPQPVSDARATPANGADAGSRPASYTPGGTPRVVTPPAIPPRPRQASGTPTGTPAMLTPSGPLPRAYLMMRRIKASGEHPAVPPRGQTPVSRPVQPDPKEGSHAPERASASPAPVAEVKGARTMDSVIDLLSKAIRDVVEPR